MKNIGKKQKQEGITLIALVVTIVVLLILAGTSIAMLTGDNGIITNAQKSQMENTKSEVIEKMNMAYNAAYSEARIKMATDPGYQPSAHIAELAGVVAKEVGVEAQAGTAPTEAVDNQYNVYYDDTEKTITMLYGDPKFALKADAEAENNLYPNIKGEITLSTTQITYTKQPNGTTNSGNGGNDPVTPNPSDQNTPNGSVTIVSGTGKNVGDIVSIESTEGTTERFYILSYNETTKKAVALAEYNLKVGRIYTTKLNYTEISSTEEGYGLQNSEMIGWTEDESFPHKGTLSFSSDRYWDSTYTAFGNSSYPYVYDSNSNLYNYVENYKTKLGNVVSKVRLAAYEEIQPYKNKKTNYPWIFATTYWLGSSNGTDYNGVWYVIATGKFFNNYCGNASYSGIRPVIEFTLQ